MVAEELSSLLRLQITSEGYLGLQLGSGAIRQDKSKTLPAAIRSFGPLAPSFGARIADAKGRWISLDILGADPTSPERLVTRYRLPGLPDGSYRLEITSVNPTCSVEVPLTLLGEFMATLDERLAKIEAFAKTLAETQTPAAVACSTATATLSPCQPA